MTKTDTHNKPTPSQRVIGLLASITQLVNNNTLPRPELETLSRALQLAKEHKLGHVIERSESMPSTTERHRLLSEQIANLTCLSPKQKKYLRERGIRYVGELYYVHFDARSRFATEAKNGILEALKTFLGLPLEFDPLTDGWIPPYWSTPGFLEALSAPVIEILGDRPSRYFGFRPRRSEFNGYTSEARWVHKRGIHYMGIYLENLRGATSNTAGSPVNGWSVGKLKDLQGKLNQSRRLWAAVLVPPYWQAPEGVPEVWTRLHEDEILPAIKAEEDRVRLAEERKRSFAAWQVRQSRHEAQFARGNPVMFDFLASDLALARPIMELCDVLWPDEPVFLTRMNELGVTTLGQVLQLSKEEVHLLIRKTIRDDVATSYYYARFAEWLHDQSGLLHPVALKPEDADNHPIPQCIIEHRVYLQELKSGLSAGTDAIVASNLNNLNKRIDELELSVRTANCLQNAHIEYVWQLCEYTEARLLKTKNFGRKSLNESKEILAELGLKLGMEFSEQARSLLSTH